MEEVEIKSIKDKNEKLEITGKLIYLYFYFFSE